MADRTLHPNTGPDTDRDAGTPTRVADRYVLRGELGRGGMASVHRAHDEVLGRDVALKLLHPHLAHDPAFLERFRREARSAAALTHPNVVGVHDWGETPDGAYLVLQIVDGLSLREVLRDRGRLDPAEALAVLGPAAAGLAAAHASGLVHRDVKPENLLIGRDGTVRVTDFGLARAAASATSTFGADVLVGSPHYLSPEAVNGQPLDARADVYALGVVLYECLVGSPPHAGETPFATALRHTSTPVPPPSAARPELSDALDDVVHLATSIDREERLPDAAAFGRVLAAAVPEGAGVVPRPAASAPSDRSPADAQTATRTLASDPDPNAHAATDTATATLSGADLEPIGPADDQTETTVVAHGGTRPKGSTRAERSATGTATGTPDGTAGTSSRRRGRAWWILGLLVLLIGGSALGGYLVWDRVIAPMTPIPGVLGAAEPAAVSQLTEAGFEVAIGDERPNDRVTPEGHVLDQQPDDAARLGATVTLVLSAGPVQVEIPALGDVPATEATERLMADGLEVTRTEAYDERIPRDAVISTSPDAGTIVDEGTEVELLVSRGPEPIAVPDLVGDREDDARNEVRESGLEFVVDGRREDPSRAGTVLEQRPTEGTELRRGEQVRVVVSDGPEQVEVPAVRGERVDDAVATLRALGFEVEVERRGGFGAFLNPDRVYDQDPAPESVRDAGDTVVLYAYEP